MTTIETPLRPPLRRSRDDRILGGVAAGLARHLGVDPLLIRIAFVVVPLALVPYLVAWVLLPSDGAAGESRDRGRRALVVGAGLVALATLLALNEANPGWLDVDGRYVAPVLLGFTGLALVVRGARD
jgi:phage shock protein PspC (stress-responsive transcriptional regulator)